MKKKKPSSSQAPASADVLPSPVPADPAAASLFRRQTWQVGAFLALATLAVYLRAVFNDWTNFDDNVYVTENPVTLRGLTWDNFVWATTGWHAAFWQPLVWLSYQLEVSLFGTNPLFYHLTNVLWHTLDTVLLFVLGRTLTGSLWRSAFVAALFALHPLHVESVAWITERKDVLSAGFFFATLIAYVHYVRAPKGRRTKPYLAALGLYLLGLMAKPMLVTMPFVMLLLDFWPLRRLDLAGWAKAVLSVGTLPLSLPFVYGAARATPQTREFRRAVAEKIPFFILTIAGAVVAIYAVADYNDLRPLSAYPIPVRIWNSIDTYCHYIRDMVWPSGLIAFYLYPTSFNFLVIALEAVLLLGITAAALWQSKARPWILFGWVWFLGTLLPVIGIVKTGSFARADRYTYIPLVGLFVIVAWGGAALLSALVADEARRRRIAAGLAGALLVLLAALTYVQIGQWAGTIPLFTRMIEVGGTENALAHYNLGLGYYDDQKKVTDPAICRRMLEKAEYEFREAFRIRPDYCQAHNNLGIVLMLLGRNDESFQNFEIAARLDPTHVPALDNYGHGLVERQRYPEAIRVLEQAVALAPDDTRAHFSLGDAYALSGRPQEAIPHLAAVLQAHPENVEARRKVALLLARIGRPDAATEQFGILSKMFPGDAATRSNYGFMLLQAGRASEAEGELREALRLQPELPEAHNNLGLALAATGRKPEARLEFETALRLRPDYPEAKENLARALQK